MRSVLTLTIVAIVLGCATPPTLEAPRTVLLAPVSFNQNLPEALEPGVPFIQDEMVRFLEARGVAVERAPLAEFHDTWLEAARPIGTLYDDEGNLDPERFRAAVTLLLDAYRARGKTYDAVLLPYLYLRVATSSGGNTMKWDGVKRATPISFEGRSFHFHIHRSKMPASSLRVFAFSGKGERLFDRYAGLEIVEEFYVRGLRKRDQNRIDMRLRIDLFQDANIVRDATGVALAPFFGR